LYLIICFGTALLDLHAKKPVLFQQFQKISVETFQGFEVNADKRNKWPAIKIFVGFWLNCNNLVLYSACKHVKIGSCFIH